MYKADRDIKCDRWEWICIFFRLWRWHFKPCMGKRAQWYRAVWLQSEKYTIGSKRILGQQWLYRANNWKYADEEKAHDRKEGLLYQNGAGRCKICIVYRWSMYRRVDVGRTVINRRRWYSQLYRYSGSIRESILKGNPGAGRLWSGWNTKRSDTD